MNSVHEKRVLFYQVSMVDKFHRKNYGWADALHWHQLIVEGGFYYNFLAIGWKQWAYKTDTVSFDFIVTDAEDATRFIIIRESFQVLDRNGRSVVRGNHAPVIATDSQSRYERIVVNNWMKD